MSWSKISLCDCSSYMMVDVSVEILGCVLSGVNFKQNLVTYELRTFWSKPVQVSGSEYGQTPPVHLAGLTRKEFLRFDRTGDKVYVGIEVHISPKYSGATNGSDDDHLRKPYESIRMGICLMEINSLLSKPMLNPAWKVLEVEDILRGKTNGTVYVKLNARFWDTTSESTNLNNGHHPSSYFSASTGSNPALFCPPHLIDHVGDLIVSKNNEIPAEKQTQASIGSSQSNTVTSTREDSSRRHTSNSRPKEQQTTVEVSDFDEISARKATRLNTCMSPDFPFSIPAVEKVQKRSRFVWPKSDGEKKPDKQPTCFANREVPAKSKCLPDERPKQACVTSTKGIESNNGATTKTNCHQNSPLKSLEHTESKHGTPLRNAVIHNTCTSSDFPFNKPSVEKVQKSSEESPPLFGYTPYMPTPKPNNDNVEDLNAIIDTLNGSFELRNVKGNKEQTTSKQKVAVIGRKQQPFSPSSRNHANLIARKGKLFHKTREMIAAAAEQVSPRRPYSPNPSTKTAHESRKDVPGLTIKKYKPPSSGDHASEENSANFSRFIPNGGKRRIAANIFDD